MSPSAYARCALLALRVSNSSYECSNRFIVPDKTSQLEERDVECEASYCSPGLSCARSTSYLGLPVCRVWCGEVSWESGTVDPDIGILDDRRVGGYATSSGELGANGFWDDLIWWLGECNSTCWYSLLEGLCLVDDIMQKCHSCGVVKRIRAPGSTMLKSTRN